MEEQLTLKEAKELYEKNNHKVVTDNSDYFVVLKNITKVYPNNVQAVYDFNLGINKNEFIALVGPSGCGKSTTLRMIAGLENITNGELYIEGVLSNYLSSKERDIAMVFQSYALYPHLNVFDNIAFGLKIRKYDSEEIQQKVFEAADILNLGEYLDCKPRELSGGQMQRVALGRAIVRKPKLFLMDEPLSNLDAKLRVQMRSEIVRIHEEVGATTIYVTHDQTEAMTMANRIVVMNKGYIQQIDEPMDVYDYPSNLFVATFIGTPPMNIIDCYYDNGKIQFKDGFEFSIPQRYVEYHNMFYKEKLEELQEILIKIDNLTEKEIKDLELKILSRKNVVEKNEIKYSKSDKKSFLEKIKHLFKKKDTIDSNTSLTKTREDFKIKITNMIEKYEEALTTKHSIKLGIRPEDIYLEGFGVGETSKPFEINCSMVEILGSEFIVYGLKNNDKITVKLQTKVKSHSIHSFVLDVLKVHLFDEFSGENVLTKYIRKEVR